MTQWIDLREHDVALLVRKNNANQNELVLKRLRPNAVIPPAALDYGFEPEGEIFVRRETRFTLPDLRNLYPGAVVADMPMEDIVYRVASEVAVLPAPAAVPQPAPAPAEPPPDDEVFLTSNLWAFVPLPRFLSEATISLADGQKWVEHSGLRFPVGRMRNEEGAKEQAHRAVVQNAIKLGEHLPFEVLVDYPDLAYFGARKSHASTRIGKLLSQLGIAEKLMQGDSGYAKLANEPYMELVVERLPYPDGDRLILTHYREQAGDKILDAEMVFSIRDGRLYLKETAVENALRGGELRGYDHYFANVFSKNLLEQGFGQAQVIWPHDPAPAPARTEPVEDVTSPADAQFIPVDTGPHAGMVMAMVLDHVGAAKLAVGMSRGAAAAALADQPASTAPGLPRQVGENLMGQALWEDELGRRHLRFGEAVLQEADGDRGLEFQTASEAKRGGQLSLVLGTPVAGALLFGKPVFRALDGQYYAIEHRAAAEIYGFRLEAGKDGMSNWVSLGEPWTQGAPSDSELRCATSQRREVGFDQAALINEINAAIPAMNAEMIDERYHVKPLDPDRLVISQPDGKSYEVRLSDTEVPVDPVRIVNEGEFWRSSRSEAHSLQGPLETVFLWANRELVNSRMDYLGHLHRAVDGNLHIGLPQAQLTQVRELLQAHKQLQAAAAGALVAWDDIGIAGVKTPIDKFTAHDAGGGRLVVGIEGMQRIYKLFALELDGASTISAYEKQAIQQVGGWLAQVDADVAWEETLRTHPAGPLLEERVRAYLDYQVKHYGSRFEARVPSQFVRDIVMAITDRNLERLIEMIGRNGTSNPSTAKLFQDISGRSLGTNKTSRQAAIYAHCGFSTEDAAAHREQRQALKRVRMLEAEAKHTIERCENFRIRYQDTVINGRQFVDQLFEQGYTHLDSRPRGAVAQYGLTNPTTRSYYEIKEPLTSYVRHLLAIRESAQPAPVPEPEDKLVPAI